MRGTSSISICPDAAVRPALDSPAFDRLIDHAVTTNGDRTPRPFVIGTRLHLRSMIQRSAPASDAGFRGKGQDANWIQRFVSTYERQLVIVLLVLGGLGLVARLWVSYLSHG